MTEAPAPASASVLGQAGPLPNQPLPAPAGDAETRPAVSETTAIDEAFSTDPTPAELPTEGPAREPIAEPEASQAPLPPFKSATSGTRPVDLLKSAAAQDHFLAQSTDQPSPDPMAEAQPQSEPQAPSAAATEESPVDEGHVPEQIRKLNETIARFTTGPSSPEIPPPVPPSELP